MHESDLLPYSCAGKRAVAISLLLVSLFLPLLKARADAAAHANQRLSAVTESSSLQAITKPWHLKLEVALLDKTGAVAETGTIERWQSGQDSRTVRTFGGLARTAVEHEGKSYREPHQPPIPDAAETLFQAVLHPGPNDSQLTGATRSFDRRTSGKTS